MSINKLAMMVLIWDLIGIYCHRIYCIPGEDYSVACNRCWCIEGKEFVCSNMKCRNIPKRFWRKVKLNISPDSLSKAARASLLMQAIKQSVKKIGPYAIEKVTEPVVDAFINTLMWMGGKLKDFGRWLFGFLG